MLPSPFFFFEFAFRVIFSFLTSLRSTFFCRPYAFKITLRDVFRVFLLSHPLLCFLTTFQVNTKLNITCFDMSLATAHRLLLWHLENVFMKQRMMLWTSGWWFNVILQQWRSFYRAHRKLPEKRVIFDYIRFYHIVWVWQK